MKIIIEVDSGCVTEVYAESPDSVQVEIVDRDCQEKGEEFRFDLKAEPLSAFRP